MKVILLEKIHNLGNLGDTVDVKAGYGRNCLIPQKKAVFATPENVKRFEAQRAELEKIAAETLSQAQKRAEQFKDLRLVLVRKAREENKLFGSVGIREIVEELAAKGLNVEKREVNLLSGVMKEAGEFDIELQFHSDVVVPVKVIIEAE